MCVKSLAANTDTHTKIAINNTNARKLDLISMLFPAVKVMTANQVSTKKVMLFIHLYKNSANLSKLIHLILEK